MVAELGYQLDDAWSQLKPKLLRTPVMDFLDWILRAGKTPNLGHTFYGGSPHRHTWKKEAFFFFVCLSSFSLLNSSILLPSIPELVLLSQALRP